MQQDLADRLAHSTVRKLLGIMHRKGYVAFRKRSKAKVYCACISRTEAQRSALRHLIERLFHRPADLLLARPVQDGQVRPAKLYGLRKKLQAWRLEDRR